MESIGLIGVLLTLSVLVWRASRASITDMPRSAWDKEAAMTLRKQIKILDSDPTPSKSQEHCAKVILNTLKSAWAAGELAVAGG